jgi:HEAT repeat protein
VAALKDSDWYVRQEAVEGLHAIGDARAVKPLIGALEDTDKDVRSGAARALGALGSTAEPDADKGGA